ncbi:MAG: ABC transporter ATP-binding protein [Acidobacteria bacterium]|nr:MAG: ABC transporter ATP-binding protein [Acidobacteriota bacterium]
MLVEAINVSYGSRRALIDVSFCVAPRQIYGLLGPNGGGKTTLFRVLCTLLKPTSGNAWVGGASVVEDPMAGRRQIGVVFQTNSLDRDLTVRENLLFEAYLRGISRSEARSRIAGLLEHFGLADRAGDMVGTLSGGLQRRLEIVKSVLHRPRVLILDEPSVSLDPTARFDLWNLLKTLRDQQSMTVLLTTHLMEEADRCDRLAILHQGRIVAEGTPESLKEKIGGDVVSIQAEDPVELAKLVQTHFGCPAQLVDGTLRLERPRGHQFVAQVIEAFPGRITAITVSRPTLEDVFIHQTGHQFVDEERRLEKQVS